VPEVVERLRQDWREMMGKGKSAEALDVAEELARPVLVVQT
jgi:hypothetical protein